MNKIKYTLVLFVSLIMFSCNQDGKVYDEVKEVGGSLKNKDSLVFVIDITDTKQAYNITTTVRNDISYPFYNLYFKVGLKDMKNHVLVPEKGLRELFVFDPQTGDPQGYTTNVVGKKMGGLYDHEYLLYKKISFAKPGKYKIVLKQYMRGINELKGIHEIGIRMYPFKS